MNNRIDELRKQKGLTWEQLSADLNMSKSVIWRFGTGERELKQNDLKTICDYFGVTPNYLLGLTDNRHSHNNTITIDETKLIEEIKLKLKQLDKNVIL